MIRRNITTRVRDALADTPVVLINGARQVGKNVRGLQALADATGKRWIGGVVFYTGSDVVPFASNLHGLPLPLLWAAPG